VREPRLYKRGKRGIWWVDYGNVGGIRHVRSTKCTGKDDARRVAAEMLAALKRHDERCRVATLIEPVVSESWQSFIANSATKQRFCRMLKNAKSRAKSSGIIWAMSDADFWDLIRRSNGKCAVTGLPLEISDATNNPNQPSIDRIDSSTGYSIGNCRLVLLAVNYAMNTWGEKTFRSIALSYAENVLKAAR